MRSLIGKSFYKTENGTPYQAYSYGIIKEVGQSVAKFNSPELAINGLMQTLVDTVLENPDKNIIWRVFPIVNKEVTKNGNEFPEIYYTAYARWCFE